MDTDLDVIRYVDTLVMTVNRSLADLKTALDARYQAQTKALDAALAATDKALTKAERELERRLTVIDQRLTKIEQSNSNG
jgi:pyruvate-formate lyase-activating enzyme